MDMITLDIMTGDGDLYGLPATDSEIETAEQTLGVKFNADYIQFIKAFGVHLAVSRSTLSTMALLSAMKQSLS